ncbi:RNA-splicing factor [Didymella glomerata]|uniref:RNA-splicing factor n=1 Tax=Didymella glomerata TaxID=749621 RepID=A0A9W8X725_9PLEO|nr:RNA-splicing factor [Didymella glomerata]
MGGDLNLKKSWHPHLRKNQERVWKEEKSALEERKQIEKLRKEREEERALEELQKLQESAGGRTVQRRVDWMYSGPGGDGAGVTEEREGYLLGKRRIDQLLVSNDTKDLQKGASVGIDALGNANANSARDTQKKVLEDPLLIIQKQKMEMQLKAMKDAQKQAKYEEKHSKERRHRERHPGRAIALTDIEMIDTERKDLERIDPERIDPEMIDPEMIDPEMIDLEIIDAERIDTERIVTAAGRRLVEIADAVATEKQRTDRVREQEGRDAEEERRIQDNLNTSKRLNAGMGDMGLGDALSRGRRRTEVEAE